MTRILLLLSFLATAAHADPKDIAVDPDPPRLPSSLPAITVPDFPPISDPPTNDSNFQEDTLLRLSRELAKAVAQGMVEVDPEADIGSELGQLTWPVPTGQSNLSIITGLDRDVLAELDTQQPAPDGTICVSDSLVDVLSWADPKDATQLGRLRLKSIAENGEFDAAKVEGLARYYVAMGFGAEAAAIGHVVEGLPNRELLLALAQIVDHGASSSAAFTSQVYCQGKVALWAALSRPIPPEITKTDHILRAFSGLPYHLRSHLGPLLAERMRDAGMSTEARLVLNAVTRAGAHSPESELMAARLGLTGTTATTAREQLFELSKGTGVVAASALLELLMDAEKRGTLPSASWIADVPSQVRAIEGTEVAENLNLAGMRGLISMGEFDLLRGRLLMADAIGITDENRPVLAARALAEAAISADDPHFLRTEVGLSEVIYPEDLTKSERFALVERLANLGLQGRALRYLPETAMGEEEVASSISTLAMTGQSERAITMVEDPTLPRVSKVLGRIYSRENDDLSARDAFEVGGHIDEATSAAMRAADWAWIANHGTTDVAAAVTELNREISAGSLEQNSAEILDEVVQRKALIEFLMLQTDPSGQAFTK